MRRFLPVAAALAAAPAGCRIERPRPVAEAAGGAASAAGAGAGSAAGPEVAPASESAAGAETARGGPPAATEIPVAPIRGLGGSPPSLYAARLAARLRRELPRPKRAPRGPAPEAIVHLRLDERGHVTAHRLVRSSGDAAFDRAVGIAAQQFAPSRGRTLPVPGDERLRERLLTRGVQVHVRLPAPVEDSSANTAPKER